MGNRQLFFIGGLLLSVGAYLFSRTQYGETIIQKGVEMVANTLSAAGEKLIQDFEGFSGKPYRDADGWSIGFGHYMGKTPAMGVISRADAAALFRQDAQQAIGTINNNVKVPLSQNQFDSLTSFIYNVGINAFKNSTLLKKLNAGDYQGAASEFLRWNKSQGKVNPALVARREAERQLFLS